MAPHTIRTSSSSSVCIWRVEAIAKKMFLDYEFNPKGCRHFLIVNDVVKLFVHEKMRENSVDKKDSS